MADNFSVLAGRPLAAVGGWFLEVVLVIGLFAADIVTGKFFHHRRGCATQKWAPM